MIYKIRDKAKILKLMTALYNRSVLSKEEYRYYLNLVSGYKGECSFDSRTKKLTCNCLVLNDLTLRLNYTVFQIDTLIITAHGIYVYEIKNFNGEYLYKEELFQSVVSGEDFQSPLSQLNRSVILLKKLLGTYGNQLPVLPFLAFVHPDFVLYEAPRFESLLLPNNLTRHFKKLDTESGTLSEQQYIMAKKLCELSAKTIPTIGHLPSYHYDNLRKGASCTNCGKLYGESLLRKRTCLCQKCGHVAMLSEIIHHNFEEFQILFPERQANDSALYRFCHEEISMKKIRAHRISLS